MGQTHILGKENTWLPRAPIKFGFDGYDFYVTAAQGVAIGGQTLVPIDATTYQTTLVNSDVYVVAKNQDKPNANKGVVPLVPVVVVGMDQWVLTDTSKGAAVCTSGIIGCIGLVLMGGSQIAVTHVLDGFEKKEPWASYKIELAKMVAAMARVDSARIVASSSIYVDKCKLLADFLAELGIKLGQQEQLIGPGFALEPAAASWKMTLAPKPLQLFAKPEPAVVSKADLYIIKSGKLSNSAADSGG